MSTSSSISSSPSPLDLLTLSDGQPALRLSSGHSFPLIGFGTWGAGDSNEKIGDAVYHALVSGYRHIDCAEYYRNQKEIGTAIQSYLSKNTNNIQRSDLFITTKIWNTNHSPERARESVLKSLTDLQLNYLDLVLIHWPLSWKYTGADFENGGGFPKKNDGELEWDPTPLSETWRALEKMVDDGLVRSIGISNYPLISVIDLLSYARIRPSVHQIELHPYLTQQHLVKFCEKNSIAISGYSPLGRPGKFHDPVIENDTVKKIASELSAQLKKEITSAQVLLAWFIHHRRSPLPKSSTPSRIESNFQSIHLKLTEEQIKLLDGLNKNHRYVNIILTGENAGTFGTRGETLFE